MPDAGSPWMTLSSYLKLRAWIWSRWTTLWIAWPNSTLGKVASFLDREPAEETQFRDREGFGGLAGLCEERLGDGEDLAVP